MLIAGALAFGLAAALVWLLSRPGLASLVLDVPNERSLHDRPIPRTGGIGLFVAAALTWVSATSMGAAGAVLQPLAGIAGALAAVFLIDDVRGLTVGLRLGAQVLAATAFLVVAGLSLPLLLLPLFVVGITWSSNLYNFMDGANGLAGGMAIAGFGAYALAAQMAGQADLAIASLTIAGAAAGFLVWNFDPARIFLGDAGSIPLGFLASTLGITGWSQGAWPFWFPLVVFSPFVVDACVTLVKRALAGERLSQAHKSHYYQRLVRMGWSHRRLALSEYALMTAAAASALFAREARPIISGSVVVLWIGVFLVLAIAIDRHWQARRCNAAA
jgi:UDP-N-acetylmuramyl pentapeptide phosphotransferase/UDP-N-acetylglucosamine-1-phosphate transferase